MRASVIRPITRSERWVGGGELTCVRLVRACMATRTLPTRGRCSAPRERVTHIRTTVGLGEMSGCKHHSPLAL